MNMVNIKNKKANQPITKEKVISITKKILLYTVAVISGLFLFAAVYQILGFLFVFAILSIACLGPRR